MASCQHECFLCFYVYTLCFDSIWIHYSKFDLHFFLFFLASIMLVVSYKLSKAGTLWVYDTLIKIFIQSFMNICRELPESAYWKMLFLCSDLVLVLLSESSINLHTLSQQRNRNTVIY